MKFVSLRNDFQTGVTFFGKARRLEIKDSNLIGCKFCKEDPQKTIFYQQQ